VDEQQQTNSRASMIRDPQSDWQCDTEDGTAAEPALASKASFSCNIPALSIHPDTLSSTIRSRIRGGCISVTTSHGPMMSAAM
jgi:hypothetical protein